jgi:hypothetical protein
LSDKIKYNFGGDDFTLPYDKFKDFKCSKHSWVPLYQHTFVIKSIGENYKYHLWFVEPNFLFSNEPGDPQIEEYLKKTLPPVNDTWNDERLWVVIDRRTEALTEIFAQDYLEVICNLGYNKDRIKFLTSSYEPGTLTVHFCWELFIRALRFRLPDNKFNEKFTEMDRGINWEYYEEHEDDTQYKKWLLDLDSPKLLEKRPYTFLNYNGTLPYHKLALLSEIYRRKLEKYFLLSATNRDGTPIDDLKERLYQFNPDDDGKIFDLLPIYFDITKDMDSDLSLFRHGKYTSEIGNSNPKKIHYNQTYFSVISETSFDFARLVGDPWKAMILHPFILNAGTGSLKLFKSFGFKSFPNVFDESYDKIEDNLERSKFIIKEIERVCLMGEDEKHKLYLDSIPIMKYNQKYLCNFDVEDMMFSIFNQLVK